MKLFVSSDWHLDCSTDGFERFDDVVGCVHRIVNEAIAASLSDDVVFVFAGDLSNPNSRNVHRATAFAVAAASLLAANRIRSVWITGNHDVTEDDAGSHVLLSVKALADVQPLVHVSDGPDCICVGGRWLLLLPFAPTKRNYDPAAAVAATERCEVVIGHLQIPGIVPGSESKEMARGRTVQFPTEALRRKFPGALLINGHYHEQQVFDGIHIPGSLVRVTHGEERNRPGYLKVTL